MASTMLRMRGSRRILFASAAASLAVVDQSCRTKLPIYPSSGTELLLVIDEPSPLERRIGDVRRATTQAYADVYAKLHGVVSRWITIEHEVENSIKSLLSPEEALMPGLLYVGVATLSGSVLARQRSRRGAVGGGVAARVLLPTALGVAALYYWLPHTLWNVSARLRAFEETYLPRVARAHTLVSVHAREGWLRAQTWTARWRERVVDGVERARDGVQRFTGLKLREGFRWRRGKKAVEAEEDVVGLVAAAAVVEGVGGAVNPESGLQDDGDGRIDEAGYQKENQGDETMQTQ